MSDSKLKPCPLCQSPHVCIMLSPQQEDGSRFYYGFCYECNAVAGEGDTEEQAAAAWNALPRHLQWTTAKPTQDGGYWYRRHSGEKLLAHIDEEMVTLLDMPGQEHVSFFDGEWAGPLPEPQESTS